MSCTNGLSLSDYYQSLENLLVSDDLFAKLEGLKEMLENCNQSGGKIMFCGNGAASAISSHAALDITKQGKLKALTFHDSAWLTALANDYGFDQIYSRSIEIYGEPGDVVILTSVSGESPNVINAANYCLRNEISVVTFTGKSASNRLRALGDLSFFVDSPAYNIVEGLHMLWITSVIDMIIGKSVYEVS